MSGITRREFVAASASAAALAAAGPVHGGARETLRVGLIGCGGRGTGAAEDCLKAAGDVELVAMADLFADRLKGSRAHLKPKIDDGRCFAGFDAYEKLLAIQEIDLVILATPPGFRPIHLAAAIEAGKHVFMEKPAAVDPAGVRKVLEAGRKAAEKKLAVVAGTQRRHQKPYVETVARIHEGAIGEIVGGRCSWNQGGLWSRERAEGWSEMEWQCRNWLYFDWLSGDHIVEQHVHNIDVINWALQAHPVRAVGIGGRQVRTAEVYGNIYDHFAVDFEYPNGVHVLSTCRQIDGTDNHVGESLVGTEGRARPEGAIEGANAWRFKGKAPNPYVQEHADLIASIRAGEPLNEARAVAESTLTAILGREAAYTGADVKWDALLNSKLDLAPAKYEFGPLAARAVPAPGRQR